MRQEGTMTSRTITLIVIGALVVLVGGYVLLAALSGRTIPHGTTVAGVDVGSKSREDAAAALHDKLDAQSKQPVHLHAGPDAVDPGQPNDSRDAQTKVRFDPAAAGVSPDVDSTVRELTGFTLNPAVILTRLSGGGERPLRLTMDGATFGPAADKAAQRLSAAPADARLDVTDGHARVAQAQSGLQVDRSAIEDALNDQWLRSADAIDVRGRGQHPQISTAAAQQAKKELADPALRKPLTLKVTGGQRPSEVSVYSAQLGQATTFPAKNGKFTRVIDAKKLHAAVVKKDAKIGEPARDASFELSGGKPRVVPSRDGRTVNDADLHAAVQKAIDDPQRTAAVVLRVQKPKFSTADAKQVDISQPISDFATPYNSEPARDANLRTATKKVSGTVVKPGEKFSLNDALGQRTAANGYRKAGVIDSGEMKEDFGGGVSQVSTTLFNAAFFAGFELNEHQAHSRYISRYPEGREATLNWRSIDMAFTNTTSQPVVLDMSLSGGKVHAKVWGKKKYDVTADASDRFNRTSPDSRSGSGAECKAQSPKPGYSITIKRQKKDVGSGAVSRDQFTTVYAPVTGISCG